LTVLAQLTYCELHLRDECPLGLLYLRLKLLLGVVVPKEALRHASPLRPRARAKSSNRRLTCSDAAVKGLRSGDESGSSVIRPNARSR
jgi:hypothetical protein